MLVYLNNITDRNGGPNGNSARELLELHTLGAENYLNATTPEPEQVPTDANGIAIGYVDSDIYEPPPRSPAGRSRTAEMWETPSSRTPGNSITGTAGTIDFKNCSSVSGTTTTRDRSSTADRCWTSWPITPVQPDMSVGSFVDGSSRTIHPSRSSRRPRPCGSPTQPLLTRSRWSSRRFFYQASSPRRSARKSSARSSCTSPPARSEPALHARVHDLLAARAGWLPIIRVAHSRRPPGCGDPLGRHERHAPPVEFLQRTTGPGEWRHVRHRRRDGPRRGSHLHPDRRLLDRPSARASHGFNRGKSLSTSSDKVRVPTPRRCPRVVRRIMAAPMR